MRLSPKEVKHIAKLARLELSEEEIDRYRSQLSDILEHFSRLQSVDTTGIMPTDRASEITARLREDDPKQGINKEDLFKNALEVESDHFRVPPVLD